MFVFTREILRTRRTCACSRAATRRTSPRSSRRNAIDWRAAARSITRLRYGSWTRIATVTSRVCARWPVTGTSCWHSSTWVGTCLQADRKIDTSKCGTWRVASVRPLFEAMPGTLSIWKGWPMTIIMMMPFWQAAQVTKAFPFGDDRRRSASPESQHDFHLSRIWITGR